MKTKTKDTYDRAYRHASRDYIIQAILNEQNMEGKTTFSEDYTLLGLVFGLCDRQLKDIKKRKRRKKQRRKIKNVKSVKSV